ncbi:hypothetical protein AB0J74_21055 [Asanoa sp. NPDC049573]|uniref:hypothetical protein n=1 Tax=Asanoa sp. NPDC049573 TaxID=3155396 RepID=UPI00343A77C0
MSTSTRPSASALTAKSAGEVDELVGGELERALDALVPQWIAADWPFEQPRYLDRAISWQQWFARPRAS